MKFPCVVLDQAQRTLVQETVERHMKVRGWYLHAINVRSNHVHLVCDADIAPERVMGELKAWSSRQLRQLDQRLGKVWTRHGSTRWINTDESLRQAVHYVVEEQ